MKDSSIEENEDTVYWILALSGDTAMLCIPSVVLIERCNVADAVAVRAIMWTL